MRGHERSRCLTRAEARRRLRQERAEIAERLRALRLGLLRSDESVEDESEVGRRGSDLDVDIARADGDVDALRRIDEMLRHVDARTFGVCQDCGAPIGAVRLRAVPFAVRCRDCESARESARPADLTARLSPERGV